MKILLLALLLASCTKHVDAPISAPVNIPAVPDSWPAAYDAAVAALVTPKMLAANPGSLCPSGKANVSFWQALIKATAKAESNWDPNADYVEKFTGANGQKQVSSGLLQISLDDKAKGTPNCLKLSAATIHDPILNISCSLEIMNILVGTRETLRISLGRYWSTIRDSKVGDVCL